MLVKMKILYISATPFGRFYFDEITHRGVAISDRRDPVTLTMKEGYRPVPSDPGFREYETDQAVFDRLLAAADKRNRKIAMEIIGQYFPETLGIDQSLP